MIIYLPMKRGIRKRFNTLSFRFEINQHIKGEEPKWEQATPSPMDIIYINNTFRKLISNVGTL